jgi:hypothetical protein
MQEDLFPQPVYTISMLVRMPETGVLAATPISAKAL